MALGDYSEETEPLEFFAQGYFRYYLQQEIAAEDPTGPDSYGALRKFADPECGCPCYGAQSRSSCRTADAVVLIVEYLNRNLGKGR
jgi:hypothetical protein